MWTAVYGLWSVFLESRVVRVEDFTGKEFKFKNNLAMQFTTRMLYYYLYGSLCVVNCIARLFLNLNSFPIRLRD